MVGFRFVAGGLKFKFDSLHRGSSIVPHSLGVSTLTRLRNAEMSELERTSLTFDTADERSTKRFMVYLITFRLFITRFL